MSKFLSSKVERIDQNYYPTTLTSEKRETILCPAVKAIGGDVTIGPPTLIAIASSSASLATPFSTPDLVSSSM